MKHIESILEQNEDWQMGYNEGYLDGYKEAKLKYESKPWMVEVPDVDCMGGAFRPDEYPVWR